MNLIYNSDQYSVVEYGADDDHEALRFGGYEITDKAVRREWFIGGTQALHFRRDVIQRFPETPSEEEMDDFLGQFDPLIGQRLMLH